MATLLSCKNCVYCRSNGINASVFQQLCDYLEAIIEGLNGEVHLSVVG